MDYYQNKLAEKKKNQHKIPREKDKDRKKRKAYEQQHTKKNAQFGMF